ncbi:hypothetical protein DNTS_016588 [Danionella cerebrum]|uniref:Ig-like domain-containing protein n=1 Tax=Danionella cerebrum TaxID=2873325 RepID=A0A553RPH9_9TELE|nr:hypothetical protein DNTS_016588 [Danionella translucida]
MCFTLEGSDQLRPVFTKQPGSIVFPLHPNEPSREVTFSCEAQGHPPPTYRVTGPGYRSVEGSDQLRPVFNKQPGSIVFPLHPNEPSREVTFSCEAQGHPPPTYRWKMNDSFIYPQSSSRYSISGGNLQISRLNKEEDAGIYQCLASNSFGTILSREASLHIA